MHRRYLILLFGLVTGMCLAQSQTVEITSEPNHHLTLQNEYVRVFRVEVPPKTATLMHWHRRDYFFISIGPADVTNKVEGKAPVPLKMVDGEVRYIEGNFAHIAVNNATAPFRNVTVEVVKPGKVAAKEERDVGIGGGMAIDTVMIKDGVRVREITLNPGVTWPRHTHKGPHLAVAISDLELRSQSSDGNRDIRLKAGEFAWNPAVGAGGSHTLTNTGKAPARFLALEFE